MSLNPDHDVQQRVFADKCRRLHSHLRGTKALLREIGDCNRTKWPVHYPLAQGAPLRRTGSAHSLATPPADTQMPPAVRHALTSALDDSRLASSLSSNVGEGRLLEPGDLSVLRLDLRLSNRPDSDVMGSLEESSIARLFDERLAQCEGHVDKLIARVADKASKILVTGDLNAGKSTLINALVRNEILPFDQQPCTMLFCEVLDASLNEGAEEIHAVPRIDAYDRRDPATFVVVHAADLEDIVAENEEQYQQLKIYTRDRRGSQPSLLHNGVVDVALIDSPGLNRDSLKTTQLFARQEEIDVVVFVVNAENHFTLSGQDFLLTAGNEKAHIFIVVNRFDAIRRKDRCERMILDQIRELSPLTYEERDDLVHFVSAHEQLAGASDAFARMEKSLRKFTLEQRFKSKLAPAQRYAANVLADIQFLAAENVAAATRRIQEINAVLREGMPRYEALLHERSESVRCADAVLDTSCLEVRRHTATHLTNTALHLQDAAEKVPYPGLLSLWTYAENVLLAIVRHLEHEVAECDRFASFTIHHARTQLDDLERLRRRLDVADPHSPSPADAAESDVAGAAAAENASSVSASQLATVGSISNALDTVQLDLADFVDLDFAHNWAALTSISASASLSLLATRSMASNVLGLLRLSSTVGATTGRRLLVAAAALVGVGTVFYVVSDMDATVRRKLSLRVALMLDDEGFVHHHAERLATETTRAVRPFVWHLQHTFQRMVEAEEHRRADHLRSRRSAQDSQIYFDELRIKARDLAGAVRAVSSGTMC
ncbi:mitofusin [Coemansia biformis]|uniref:Mitofusin n=1 Tax=Coemansia biformis TaxID=1286918 RepID=A0A9W7YI19_9FUNG|nr:mitofusin [Coemansia biformis]